MKRNDLLDLFMYLLRRVFRQIFFCYFQSSEIRDDHLLSSYCKTEYIIFLNI